MARLLLTAAWLLLLGGCTGAPTAALSFCSGIDRIVEEAAAGQLTELELVDRLRALEPPSDTVLANSHRRLLGFVRDGPTSDAVDETYFLQDTCESIRADA